GSGIWRSMQAPRPNRIIRDLLLAGILLFCTAGTPADAGWLLLENARIVDPARRVEFTGHVLIRDEKVAEVLQEPPPEFQGEVVDLSGKYLVPGLVDAHVHSWGNRAPVGEPDE